MTEKVVLLNYQNYLNMVKTKVLPRGQYILVKPVSIEDKKNENGLIIPKSVEQEQKSQGAVIAVGNEVKMSKRVILSFLELLQVNL